MVSVGEQGQGNEGIFRQIAADGVGVDLERVRVVTGDTEVTPYGGGTWASRGAGIGGEAVLLAAQALRANILTPAAVLKREWRSWRCGAGRWSMRAAASAAALRSLGALPTTAPTRCRATSRRS